MSDRLELYASMAPDGKDGEKDGMVPKKSCLLHLPESMLAITLSFLENSCDLTLQLTSRETNQRVSDVSGSTAYGRTVCSPESSSEPRAAGLA